VRFFCYSARVIGVMCNILHVLAAGIDNDDRDVGGSQVYLLSISIPIASYHFYFLR